MVPYKADLKENLSGICVIHCSKKRGSNKENQSIGACRQHRYMNTFIFTCRFIRSYNQFFHSGDDLPGCIIVYSYLYTNGGLFTFTHTHILYIYRYRYRAKNWQYMEWFPICMHAGEFIPGVGFEIDFLHDLHCGFFLPNRSVEPDRRMVMDAP